MIIGFSLNRLWIKLNSKKLCQSAVSIVCKKPYILRTPFWNYLATSLSHYGYIAGDYEPQITSTIKKFSYLFGNGSYFINIWSNIWRYAIWITVHYWLNTIAFEPNPETFHNLRINTCLSNLEEKIELFNIWLWDTDWEASFNTWVNCDWMAHIIDNNVSLYDDDVLHKWKIIKIPVFKFDDLKIEKEKINNTRLIIIDVEGYEYHVLKWMEQSLKEFKNVCIIVEIRGEHKRQMKTIDYLKSLWYKAVAIDEENWLFTKI